MEASRKFLKARTALVLDHPFFGSIALRLKVVEDNTCQTLWVDGISLGYNPKFVDTLTLDEAIAGVAHEVMHLVLMHDIRRGNRHHMKWNMAGDYPINWILQEARFEIGQGLLNDEHKDASADFYYNLLPDPIENKQDASSFAGNIGEVRDQPSGKDGKSKATNAEKNQQMQERRIVVAQAVTSARKAGSMPGCLSRLVDEIVEPKLDWKTILYRFVQKQAKTDYSWSPPNRRFVHMGLYFPSISGQEIDNIILAIDSSGSTSGSISNHVLIQFASELTAILEAFETTLDVLYCDTEVRKHERLNRDDLPLRIGMYGGGGTRFSPVFDWVDESGKIPACLIYLTDLECYDFPDPPPGYPTLWIKTGKYGQEPPFGEIVEL